jgi:hypothetical protein
MKHNVVLYAVVCVKVNNVEAENHVAAMEKVDHMVDTWRLFNRVDTGLQQHLSVSDEEHDAGCAIAFTEFADDIDGYLVDEVGDEYFEKSKWYDKFKKQVTHASVSNKKKKK